MTGDVDLLKLAVLHDPLVGAICTPDEVWQMVDELLVAQAQWLPQYARAIPAAIERLKSPGVKTRNWDGAARLKVRPMEELRTAKAKLSASEGHLSAQRFWAEKQAGCCGHEFWLLIQQRCVSARRAGDCATDYRRTERSLREKCQ